MEMIQLLEEKQQAATAEGDRALVAANAAAIFDDGFSWVGGNPDGSFTVVEFLDYQCGFCRKAQPELTELIDERRRHPPDRQGDADPRPRLRARGPRRGRHADHQGARRAYASAARPADGAEGRDHRRQPRPGAGRDRASTPRRSARRWQDPEVDRRLAATRELAEKLAISGTPTFVFDNRMVRGYLPLTQMRDLVGEVRGRPTDGAGAISALPTPRPAEYTRPAPGTRAGGESPLR